jgi:isopentenyl-diphosphate delta-isomerase
MSTKSGDIGQRKADHIDLAFASQAGWESRDTRFYYEPLITTHPVDNADLEIVFLGKTLRYPVWVSSMTGGTEAARKINENLARMCGEFGFGMGLGSCRVLIENPGLLSDFDVRKWIGPDYPLYANLGIAQIEKMLQAGQEKQIRDLLEMLQADGLMIHVNPMQEWLQPGGDRFRIAPVETIRSLLKEATYPVIVKEVGQGMGPESLSVLLGLPVAAIELGAHGGTNFAMLELLRDKNEMRKENYRRLGMIGHSAEEMVSYINNIEEQLRGNLKCRQIIISGGIRDFLDGFYLMKKLNLPAIYGQASGFLKHAQLGYDQLQAYARIQTAGLKLAYTYLRVR